MKSMVCTQANPKLISWSRKSSGVSVERAAKRVKLTQDAYLQIESGEEHLTLSQLRLLAVLYKRPVAVFFLPQPPQDTKRPKDFRGHKGQLSTKTIVSIRRSRRVQQLAKEFMPDDVNTQLWERGSSVQQNAQRARKWLGLNEAMQTEAASSKDFFNEVSDLLAQKETHVLLHSFPTQDAQAYSFPEIPRIITISTGDSSVEARLFSLFHELYHISLGESGLCYTNTVQNNYQHERLCDEFASLVLMPESLTRSLTEQAISEGMNLEEQLTFLTKKIKASKYALLIRLQELNYIDEQQVSQQVAQWRKKKGRASFGRTNRIATVLKENGKLFTGCQPPLLANTLSRLSEAA
ncbi:MAG: XRE family transcriptional regulator [Candidatus Saccharimonadales bacterium]